MNEVNDPDRSLAAANGQFLLIERSAYFAVGGHRAVAADVLEDVALARIVKQSKRTLRFRYAPDALSTRMYRTTAQMIEGWTKNLAVLFPRPVYLAAWRALDLALYFGLPLLAFGIFWLVPWQRTALMLLWARTLWRFYAKTRPIELSSGGYSNLHSGSSAVHLSADQQHDPAPSKAESCLERP